MTNSFQSTAFQSSASPVDTFVAPPNVQPNTGLQELASALKTINPNLQNFVATRMEKAVENERADITMEIAKKGFKQIITDHRNKFGDAAANQLIGGSIFTNDEFRKRQAQNVGLNLKTNLLNLYNNKTFNFTDRDGNEVTKPINHFAIDSPQYQEFIEDAISLTAQKTQGLSNKHLAKQFYPYQQKAIQQITAEHLKENNKYKLERYTNKLQGLMFSNWREYDQGNQEQALENIQDMIESSVDLGLASKVTPSELLKIAKNQASRIFDIEQSSGGNGYNAANKYLKMIGKLKTGPQELQKDGTYKQRELSESFGEDILKFKTKLADSHEKLKKLEREQVQAAEESNIERFVEQFATNNDALNDLLKANPDRREFIFDQIEVYSGNRDDLFDDFNYKVATGYYANDPVTKFNDLAAIKASIGATFTEEDRKNYTFSFNVAKTNTGNTIGKYDKRIQRMHTDAKQLLGNTGFDQNTFEDKNDIEPYIDLKGRIDRRIIDEVINEPGLTTKEREDTFREIQADYVSNINAIKTGEYKDSGTFDTEEQKEDKIKKEAIQAIAEDYGMSMENATAIYNEEFIETEINPTETVNTGELFPNTTFDSTEEINKIIEANQKKKEGETTQVQTENTTDNTTTEPGLIELLREGIGNLFSMNDDQTEQLTTQLSSIRENLDETSIGVVDTILNALSGPPAMAGELEGKPRSYTVKSGDTLEAIAEDYGIELDALINANKITDPNFIKTGQQLIIPAPVPTFIDKYKDKPVPDFGGLGKLVISGESLGSGSYNAFNKGSTDTAGKMDITSKTISEMKQLQSEGKVSAVGAYQFTEGVLEEAREVSGIAEDAIMTPAVQDRLFWAMLTGGKKKPDLTDYLLGKSDDLRKAHEDLANEFAALEGPDGKGMHDKDKAGNLATVKAAAVKAALIKARKQILKELK